ncbi:MAG: hypothetical protein JO057_32050 [Chloroflexi bacterium]|nr:hypothetical protein [Chloroflexota bacterium]
MISELRLARRELRSGHFDRAMALMAAFAALASGWEAYAQHLRGAFAHWLMWTPVLLTPPTVIAGVGGLVSRRLAHQVLPGLAAISFIDGLIGFVFHLRGIQDLPGGFKLGRYNLVMGPPVFAPLLTCTVGVLGLLAGLLRHEQFATGRWQPSRPVRRRGWLANQVAHGRFQRLMALTTAVFAVLAGGEAYLEHLRGSFNRRLMWTPVWLTPPMVAACVASVVSSTAAARILPVASAVTFADGLLGFGLHLQGIQRMPGGFRNLQFNFTMGPPVFAPLLFSSVGLLGFVAALVRRGQRT